MINEEEYAFLNEKKHFSTTFSFKQDDLVTIDDDVEPEQQIEQVVDHLQHLKQAQEVSLADKDDVKKRSKSLSPANIAANPNFLSDIKSDKDGRIGRYLLPRLFPFSPVNGVQISTTKVLSTPIISPVNTKLDSPDKNKEFIQFLDSIQSPVPSSDRSNSVTSSSSISSPSSNSSSPKHFNFKIPSTFAFPIPTTTTSNLLTLTNISQANSLQPITPNSYFA